MATNSLGLWNWYARFGRGAGHVLTSLHYAHAMLQIPGSLLLSTSSIASCYSLTS